MNTRSSTSAEPLRDFDAPTCIRCGYNLTGLTRDICPECGWTVDWDLAACDLENRRPGTVAHRAKNQFAVARTAATVFSMLFTPWRFAREIRYDESIVPSLSVAVLSLAITFVPWTHNNPTTHELLCFLSAIITVVIANSVLFASLCFVRTPRRSTWGKRFRLWLLISLYSTCFVASWRCAGPPIVGLTDATVYTPLIDPSFLGPQAGATLIFYW